MGNNIHVANHHPVHIIYICYIIYVIQCMHSAGLDALKKFLGECSCKNSCSQELQKCANPLADPSGPHFLANRWFRKIGKLPEGNLQTGGPPSGFSFVALYRWHRWKWTSINPYQWGLLSHYLGGVPLNSLKKWRTLKLSIDSIVYDNHNWY